MQCLEISLLLDMLISLNVGNSEGNQPGAGSLGSTDSGINEQPVQPASIAAAAIYNVVNVRYGTDVPDATQEEANTTLHVRTVPVHQPATPPIEFNELFMSIEREDTAG